MIENRFRLCCYEILDIKDKKIFYMFLERERGKKKDWELEW